ncbi:hypothetical protein KT71_000676 [Congregibacter litoralis KT71]|uniref:Uncharacterized protein n=1 Tax=Congregibacter litoralis KT71 TaxID=314285 RepID=V7HV21_9GAMM|nr:hypothetical protein KT71_000676 [Congregibacter litoralis KT71]
MWQALFIAPVMIRAASPETLIPSLNVPQLGQTTRTVIG